MSSLLISSCASLYICVALFHAVDTVSTMGCAALRIVLATLFTPETTVFTTVSPKIAVATVFTAFPMPLTTF